MNSYAQSLIDKAAAKPARTPDASAAPVEQLPALMTIKQVREYFAVSKEHIGNLLSEGALEGIDIASPGASRPCWRIKRESILQFERKGKTA